MIYLLFTLDQWLRDFESKEKHPLGLYMRILSELEYQGRYDELRVYLKKAIKEHGYKSIFFRFWRYLGCDGLPILFSRPIRSRVVRELRKIKKDSLLILLRCSQDEHKHFFIVPLLEKGEKDKAKDIFLSSPAYLLSPEDITSMLSSVDGEEFDVCFEHVSKTKKARLFVNELFSKLVFSDRLREAEMVYSRWKRYIDEKECSDAIRRMKLYKLAKEGKFEECIELVGDKVEEAIVLTALGDTRKAWDALLQALRMGKDVPGDLLILLRIADPKEVSQYAREKLTGKAGAYNDPWIRYIKGEPDTLSFLSPFYLYRDAKMLWKEGRGKEAKRIMEEIIEKYPLSFPSDLSRNLIGIVDR